MGEEHNFSDFKCLVAVKMDHIMNMLCTASCALNKVHVALLVVKAQKCKYLSVTGQNCLVRIKSLNLDFILNVLCPKIPVIHELGIGHHNKKY